MPETILSVFATSTFQDFPGGRVHFVEKIPATLEIQRERYRPWLTAANALILYKVKHSHKFINQQVILKNFL
ncbi:hypothetical protein DVQ51_17385 [Yersinia enterocolitica]|nr:hypothetical protein [Yersinia enterocolitica]EKN6028942.1 hypothetical protein [Yersinia enterocolitica]EKN6110100.1 hypothetical protein [Yersinia enterocolitica]EKN6156966.1 hypothetical protein [Yersinia enterocolitica]EKN6174840.1 hypothetical protein [Yersinia enterocolitica]